MKFRDEDGQIVEIQKMYATPEWLVCYSDLMTALEKRRPEEEIQRLLGALQVHEKISNKAIDSFMEKNRSISKNKFNREYLPLLLENAGNYDNALFGTIDVGLVWDVQAILEALVYAGALRKTDAEIIAKKYEKFFQGKEVNDKVSDLFE